ncbi:MAG: M42 family metallopeptidase [Anaerolineales bacterium]
MSSLPPLNTPYLLDFLTRLLNIPSPTGYSESAIALVENELATFNLPALQTTRTRKGALVARWQGRSHETPRALTAHVDTLGCMVKEIKPNGRLRLTRLGGLMLGAVESEGCWVLTQGGKRIRGAYLFQDSSVHVYSVAAHDGKRSEETMEVRLDARASSADETRALGINVGDFVVFDTRTEITDGFIRARFLDDKAGVAAILAAIKSLAEASLTPAQTAYFHVSNYEEVGHGASAGIPPEVQELVVVDMAAIGAGQESDEFHATLCVKDSGGPYHHGLSQKLRRLAGIYDIPHKIDIYPYYGSDGTAFWRAGGDVAVALIGPGVDASHAYERTHIEALEATTNWITAYLLD